MAFLNLFQPGFRQFAGEQFNNIFNGITSVPAMKIVNETITGTQTVANNVQSAGGLNTQLPQLVTAAGSTQLGAAAITGSLAIINVSTTASTHGVRLPTGATGLIIEVGNLGTFGVFVYPATNGKIGAAATNIHDTVLPINKANRYVALNKTLWVVNRGA